MPSVHKIYSIRHFNEVVIAGRKCEKDLDHIKKIKNDHLKQDIVLRMVISNFKITNWVEFYGLNLEESMNLEFSQYMFMVEELKDHTDKVEKLSDPLKKSMLKSIEENNKVE